MTQPFFYSKSSCCLPLPSSHHRRTLLAANDALFVLIEEDESNPDADATLRVLPRQRGEESAGSRAPASGREIAIPREHLPFGWAGSTNAPCVLTTSAAASAFYIVNQLKNYLLKVDTSMDRESTQLQVMQYNAVVARNHRPSMAMPIGLFELSALGMDADGDSPLFIKVIYTDNGYYFMNILRFKFNVKRRDACELEITKGGQRHENAKYSIASDGKQKVAISNVYMIDVYDCLLNTLIYSISIPAVHRPSLPIFVTFTMLRGEEWILCSEKMIGTAECFNSGKQRVVRLAPREQSWREIVFPPTFFRDDLVNAVAIGRDLYYASCDGIRVMNEGPAPLEQIARALCVAKTRMRIRKVHPYMVNYPVRLFYAVMYRTCNDH